MSDKTGWRKFTLASLIGSGTDMEANRTQEYIKKHGKKPKYVKSTPNPKILREFTIW